MKMNNKTFTILKLIILLSVFISIAILITVPLADKSSNNIVNNNINPYSDIYPADNSYDGIFSGNASDIITNNTDSSIFIDSNSSDSDGILRTASYNDDNMPYYYINNPCELKIEHPSNSGTVSLPETYYVRSMGEPDVTIEGVTYRKVYYNGIEGMVDINYLSSKFLASVNNPYFSPKDNLSPSDSSGVELWLYHSVPDESMQADRLRTDIRLKYLAKSADDPSYIYVRTVEDTPRYGFVNSKLYTPIIIYKPNPNAINPDTVTDKPTIPPATDNTTSEPATSDNAVRIILITVLCLLAVFVVFLLFKPAGKKKTPKDDFYEI